MRPSNIQVFQAITGSTNGSQIFAHSVIQASLTGIGTGTLAGTIKFQGSNDWDPTCDTMPSAFAVSNWVDIASATASVTAATGFIIPKFDVCYEWIRVVFTASGGTGTLSANVKTNAI